MFSSRFIYHFSCISCQSDETRNSMSSPALNMLIPASKPINPTVSPVNETKPDQDQIHFHPSR